MERITFNNGKVIHEDGYTKLFYTNLPLRPSCGVCPFSGMNRRSDFTIGDYWGVQNVYPDFHDENGVSLLFLNSDRSIEIFESIKNEFDYLETDEEHAALQPNLKGHTIVPKCRDLFWRDFHSKGISYCIKHWSPKGGILFKIKRKLMKIIKLW